MSAFLFTNFWTAVAEDNTTGATDQEHNGPTLSDLLSLSEGCMVQAPDTNGRWVNCEIVKIERNWLKTDLTTTLESKVSRSQQGKFPSKLLLQRNKQNEYFWRTENEVRFSEEFLEDVCVLGISVWRVLAMLKVDLALLSDIQVALNTKVEKNAVSEGFQNAKFHLDGPILEWAEASAQKFLDDGSMIELMDRCLDILENRSATAGVKGFTAHGLETFQRAGRDKRTLIENVRRELEEVATKVAVSGSNTGNNEPANVPKNDTVLTDTGKDFIRLCESNARKYAISYALLPFHEIGDYQKERGVYDLSAGRVSIYLHLIFGQLEYKYYAVIILCAVFQIAAPVLLVLYELSSTELNFDSSGSDFQNASSERLVEKVCGIPRWEGERVLLKIGFAFAAILFSLRIYPRAYEAVALGAGQGQYGTSGIILRKIHSARYSSVERRGGKVSVLSEAGFLVYQILNGYLSFFIFGAIFFVLYLSADLVDFILKGIALTLIDDLDEYIFKSYLWSYKVKKILRAQVARLHLEHRMHDGYLRVAEDALAKKRKNRAPDVDNEPGSGQGSAPAAVSISLEALPPPGADRSEAPVDVESCPKLPKCSKTKEKAALTMKEIDEAMQLTAKMTNVKRAHTKWIGYCYPCTPDEDSWGLTKCCVWFWSSIFIMLEADRVWLNQWKAKVNHCTRTSFYWAIVLSVQFLLNQLVVKLSLPALGLATVYFLLCA